MFFSGQIWTFLDKKTSAPPRPTHEIKFRRCRHVQNLSEVLKISSVQPGTNFRVFYLLKPTVREVDSRGWPGFKSRPGQTSKTCNFEALEVTAMYFTFLETSNLFLFGQERSRVQLYVQSMICYQEYPQVYFIKSQSYVIRCP